MDETMQLLKRCVLAIEAIHKELEPYSESDPNATHEATAIRIRIHPLEARELYEAYHAAVNVAIPVVEQ